MITKLVAIKLGTDPVGELPPWSFHRTLEEFLYCPKCDATYSVLADYEWAVSRHFEDESRRHIMLLKKTLTRGHAVGHRITHFETNGVHVVAHTGAETIDLSQMRPATKHIM